ncbi:hypothetical protein QS257_02150 [Terrilactibacillus sp. S3-3]|nr:hypothetical protein QS257_02150 [Terrilactibacillus sp. S3-3]
MRSGELSKQYLVSLDRKKALRELTNIRGIGDWSANYVMMRCLRDQRAFPIGDIGLQNAIKARLQLQEKPKPDEVKILGSHWSGWEAYATFYLERSDLNLLRFWGVKMKIAQKHLDHHKEFKRIEKKYILKIRNFLDINSKSCIINL